MQVLLDVMMSFASKWNSGSSVLLPTTTLIEHATMSFTTGHEGLCPFRLAEKLWELIEQIHEQPDMPLSEVVQEPSCN